MTRIRRKLLVTAYLALAGLAGCGAEFRPPAPAAGGVAELRILGMEPTNLRGVARDAPLTIRFSAPLDAATLAPGSVRVVRRDTGAEVPVGVGIEDDRLVLSPPEPFGFEPETGYVLVIEGFPSLLAPRSRDGEPLVARYRVGFETSVLYRPDLVPPRVVSLDLEVGAAGDQAVHVRFSEPVDPGTVLPGRSFRVTDERTGEPVEGRLISDRLARWFRFYPGARGFPPRIHVRLTAEITDRAGNPLHIHERAEGSFVVPGARADPNQGEIAEDFTTTDYLDPAGTTALWNGSRFPGTLLADPATTILPVEGEVGAPETFLGLGGGEIRIEILLTRRELGVAREISGLVWSPAGTGFAPAEYDGLQVRIAPTTRETLDGEGYETGPEETVLASRPWRIREEEWERVGVPFSKAYSYDGEANLRLTIVIGPGDHTNFIRCRGAAPGIARVVTAEGEEALRPVLGLRCFSLRPVATSRFYDSGLASPVWLPPVVQPETLPDGATAIVSFQGARRLEADGGAPADDPAALSGWTTDPTLLSGYRYLRFRVEFSGVGLTGTAAIDDIIVPFRRRP